MGNRRPYFGPLFAVAMLSLSPVAVRAQDVCSVLAGASVIADDGRFLGKVSSDFDAQSIFNEFGTYGSEFSAKSIWNQFGKYGGEFSPLSPFNKFSTTPPAIRKRTRYRYAHGVQPARP